MRSILRALSIVAVVAGSVALEARAAAADADANPVDEARRHHQTGAAFFNEGDYRLALVEFEKAYELARNYRVLYNIGQVQYQLNHYSKALRTFRRYLDDGGADVAPDRRASVQADIEALRSRVAQLTVTANVASVEVRIDDESLGTAPIRDAWVDIGPHTLTLSREGYKTSSQPITLAGRDSRTVDVQLQKEESRILVQPSNGVPAQVWIGWSVTAALGIGTLATGLLTASAAKDIDEARKRNTTTNELNSLGDKKDRLSTTTLVLGGATAAAAGVSIFLTISSSRKPSTPTQAGQVALRLAPAPGGVVLDGTF